ncbi:MAG: hypothetical protein ACFFDN_30035, partial [Candidatus Hodarchaeota archaeon]
RFLWVRSSVSRSRTILIPQNDTHFKTCIRFFLFNFYALEDVDYLFFNFFLTRSEKGILTITL